MISQNFGGGTTGSVGPSQATAVFDHVSRSGRWRGRHVGRRLPRSRDRVRDRRLSPGRRHVHRDRLRRHRAGPSPATRGKTIDSHLVGTFAGLIAVIVVATLFITAEYRRGLIRTTLAASPRRGRVLAAKAIVIGAVAFVAGLAAAAAASDTSAPG